MVPAITSRRGGGTFIGKLIRRLYTKDAMNERKTWNEFRSSGMLWAANRILHMFGWAITYEYDGEDIVKVYPVRTKLRGFAPDVDKHGFQAVSDFVADNAEDLAGESRM
jgi:hypothetical protein